jgi:hypothetical protein
MRLRLPEQPQQRKGEAVYTSPAIQHFTAGQLYGIGGPGAPKKNLKKILTLTGKIQYERGWLQNRQRTFAR